MFSFLGIVGIMYFSYGNQEVTLRNQIVAQQKANEATYDEVWKVISQVAQVSENYKDSFKDIYVGVMNARYSKGDGTLMKWIKEASPVFETKLYEKVANAIESQRATFTREQKKLIDIKREHDNLLDIQPGHFFLVTIGGKQKIDVQIVTSTRTDKAFKSGKDDDVDVFNKKK
jgi:hypothetical protein